ncbi:hypothetical protein HG536_0C05890 [Torulaspora globosa]|uniref:Uncharacterized protein n=1 Tax=Torulaspora globosa TaxID=48254 RepID=A0A7G3ZFY4_9SACH|nr:uncharacterized protein HG536_0C05890 [Torulaspora globosa]QLL32420.1 hypothetical protein HG536_0C05890 [Torulaspora globosa]
MMIAEKTLNNSPKHPIAAQSSARMRLSRLLKPGWNLTAFERLILWIRLASSTLIIALGITVMVGPITAPTTFALARFGTKSSDITKGLFDVLKDAVEVFGSTDVNNGVGLTTSEIFILTDYAASQIKSVPQYIAITLYGRCDINFNTTFKYGPNGHAIEVRNSSVIEVCFTTGPEYVFDYREVLSQLGLDIILSYAYDQNLPAVLGLSSSYSEYIKNLQDRKIDVVYLIMAVMPLEIIIVVLTVWYYSIKGKHINPLKERVLSHLISVISLTAFVTGLTGAISLVWLAFNLKNRIKSELEAFGFSYGLESAWFTCLWFFAFFMLVSTLAWCGLEWCLSDSQRPYNDETQNNILRYRAGLFVDANGSFTDNASSDGDIYRTRSNTGATSRDRANLNPFTAEEVELQDIALYSSGDDECDPQKVVKPSSAMYF